jgi:hypothetical protein
MANINNILNGDTGLSARQKLLILIDFYNQFVSSDGSYNLQSFSSKKTLVFKGATDGLSKIEFIPTDGGAGIINVYNNAGVLKTTINGSSGITSQAFIKSGGTSAEFLKANGTVDSTAYQTALVNGLADLLGINPSTGGLPIKSPDGNSILSVSDGYVDISAPEFSAIGYYSDGSSTEIYADSGFNVKKIKAFIGNASLVTGIKAIINADDKIELRHNLIEVSQAPTTANGIVNKAYADGLVVGLLNDRGSHNASINLFPSTGGSGVAGAIMKGDLWYISVAGTLGGAAVNIGDSVRALVDAPGTTSSNWSILESNIGYVPEAISNKVTTFATLNNNLYPSTQAVANYVASTAPAETTATIGAIVNGAIAYTTPLDADLFGIWDFANSLYKKLSLANLKATLAGYFVSYQILTPTLSATPTINTGTFRETFVDFTGLNTNITDLSTNLSGTPSNGARLKIRWKDNGTARTIVHGSKFAAKGVSLLGTTVIGKESETAYDWNSNTNLWGCVASVTEV